MAFKLSINMGKFEGKSILIDDFDKTRQERAKRALEKSGAILESQIKKNLSGPSHTRYPGNANRYPGVLSGVLRSSVRYKISSDGFELRVGPGNESSKYSAIHEYGGMAGRGGRTRIPKRSYMKPSWEQKRQTVRSIIKKALFAKLK